MQQNVATTTKISFWRNNTLCFCISNSLGQCTSDFMICFVTASSQSIPTSQHFHNKQYFSEMFPSLVYFTRNFCEVVDIVQVVCRSHC